jgi:hypothetical protein
VLAPVALGDRDDELLADIAREVEIDVRHTRELPVEESPEREIGGDGIDVRKARQVADERADRAAAASPGREQVPGRARPAHLGGDFAREVEHFPVEEEEAREADLGDERELFAQAGVGPVAKERRRMPVALVERPPAHLRQLRVGGLLAIGEIGIAVAELLGQVELEPVG